MCIILLTYIVVNVNVYKYTINEGFGVVTEVVDGR